MRRQLNKKVFTLENLFVGAFLFLYAVILLSSDPEWILWAGPITLGAFPIAAPPVVPAYEPVEAFQAASFGVLLGSLALLALMSLRVETNATRHSEGKSMPAEEKPGQVHEVAGIRKAA